MRGVANDIAGNDVYLIDVYLFKQESKFTKCGVYILLKHGLHTTKDAQKRETLILKRNVHLQQHFSWFFPRPGYINTTKWKSKYDLSQAR